MDFSPQLARRWSALNPGKHAQFTAVHVSPDGHGSYQLDTGDKTKTLFVNKPEANSLSHGKTNPNLDNHLRLISRPMRL